MKRARAICLCTWLAILPTGLHADGAPGADPVDLPMVIKDSTDPSLPGKWYILDRAKAVRKLLDVQSFVPPAPLEMVLIETRKQLQVKSKADFMVVAMVLPADVGTSQYFLGCMPTVTAGGKPLTFEVKFFQGKGPGLRLAEIAARDAPGGVPVDFVMKSLVLLPRFSDDNEQITRARQFLMRPGKMADRRGKAGFPDPDFNEGGPQYVQAKRGATCLQTLVNVYRRTNALVADSPNPEDTTLDPDMALQQKKSTCVGRARVVQKAMLGIARSFLVRGFDLNSQRTGKADAFGRSHALLYMEEPATGKFFEADPAHQIKYDGGELLRAGPPDGNFVAFCGPGPVQGLPNKYRLNLDAFKDNFRGMAGILSKAKDNALTFNQYLSLTGSSQGGANADKFRAWLAKVPADFAEMAKKLPR